MTSTVEQLVEQIRVATDYQKNKYALKEKILTDLHLVHAGGLFLINPATLAFVATWPHETLFLEDVYSNPISINRDEFLTVAREHYQSVMNLWHIEHDKLKQIRKI